MHIGRFQSAAGHRCTYAQNYVLLSAMHYIRYRVNSETHFWGKFAFKDTAASEESDPPKLWPEVTRVYFGYDFSWEETTDITPGATEFQASRKPVWVLTLAVEEDEQ